MISIAVPPMISGSSRALVKTKNEMKKFPCTKHTTKRCESEFYEPAKQTHQSKPREDKIEGLVKEFDMYPEFARKGV